MTRTTRVPVLFLILFLAFLSQSLLAGIGTRDTGNDYANVGALALKDNFYNEVFQVCSGVLIADQVFLTAGHCTAWAEAWRWYFETGELEFIVTFEPDFYEGATPPDVDPAHFRSLPAQRVICRPTPPS